VDGCVWNRCGEKWQIIIMMCDRMGVHMYGIDVRNGKMMIKMGLTIGGHPLGRRWRTMINDHDA
jgi:hypothetical protein